MFLKKIKNHFHPIRILMFPRHLIRCYLLPDELCLKLSYRRKMGSRLNLDNPRTFTEKIQWLKLHDRKPVYHSLVDKYEAKKVIGNLIGEQYIIKPLGVWDNYEDIDFSVLPDCFVLKFTHDSHSTTVCTDKSRFDKSKYAGFYAHSFRNRDFYHRDYKEWAYKGVKPRIIAEPYLKDDRYEDLSSYEIYCCNGVAKCIVASINKLSSDSKAYIYTFDWERMHPELPNVVDRPKSLELMKVLAEKVAHFIDNPFVRVDFYEIGGKPFFGEVTFYPNAGMKGPNLI